MLDTAIAIIIPTGLTFNLFETARAIGAIIRTVATLSINADTIPANNDNNTMVHLTFGTFSIITSAIKAGILLSIIRVTVPIVPNKISKTLKSTATITSDNGSIPNITNEIAEIIAIQGLYF